MAFEMIEKYRIYHCESGDVKKTDEIDEGSWLFETDTRNKYIFNGTAWVIFSDSFSPIATTTKSATNLIPVDATVGGTVILAANSSRISARIHNQDSQPVLISYENTASITVYNEVLAGASGVRAGDGGFLSYPEWKGQIRGITEAGSTVVSIFEKVVS